MLLSLYCSGCHPVHCDRLDRRLVEIILHLETALILNYGDLFYPTFLVTVLNYHYEKLRVVK